MSGPLSVGTPRLLTGLTSQSAAPRVICSRFLLRTSAADWQGKNLNYVPLALAAKIATLHLTTRTSLSKGTTLKKILIRTLSVLVITALAVFIFREPLKEMLYAGVTKDMFVAADNDSFDPGPALGSTFPGVRARYQGEEISLLTPFAGLNGTVLIASRSMDWCPYCMKQMIQLQTYKADYDAAGIGLVGITYDSPEKQQAFIDKFGINIPLISDIDVMSFKTLGIVNDSYQPGEEGYGIPFPGMIVIDTAGKVVGKLFLEGYSTRVDSQAALVFAQEALRTANTP
jgi:peroxiredoxin